MGGVLGGASRVRAEGVGAAPEAQQRVDTVIRRPAGNIRS
jgi:hypothetical protein